MSFSNVAEFTAAASGHGAVHELLSPTVERVRDDPTRLVPALDDELPEPDRRVVADFGIRRMLAATFAEALRHSPAGWVDDALAFSRPWGFDPGSITVPTLLWHGGEDVFSPAGHSRWLGERIPDATLVIEESAAHFGSLAVLPDILAWLADRPGAVIRRAAAPDQD